MKCKVEKGFEEKKQKTGRGLSASSNVISFTLHRSSTTTLKPFSLLASLGISLGLAPRSSSFFPAHHARSRARPGPQRPPRCGGGKETRKRRRQRRSPARAQGFFDSFVAQGRWERRRRRPRCGQVDAPHDVSFPCCTARMATLERVLARRRWQGRKKKAEKRGERAIPLVQRQPMKKKEKKSTLPR